MVRFFSSYWPYRDLRNVDLFHYSDMKRDLEAAIISMARALDLEYGSKKLREFADAASFDHMKNNAQQFAPMAGAGVWKSEAGFFAIGQNAQWTGKWSESQVAAFDERIGELISTDESDWLLHGAG